MQANEPQICEAFSRIADLCMALDQHPLTKHARCWEHQVDEHWWISVNGHPEPVENSDGFEVAPYNCVVKFNGWPAGYFDPRGGIIAAGAAANEESFLAALKAAKDRLAVNVNEGRTS